MDNPFRAALLLAEAFHEEGVDLSPTDTMDQSTPEGHYAEVTTTGVILLYVVGALRDLAFYDLMFEGIATRTAVERDGRMTVFTYKLT